MSEKSNSGKEKMPGGTAREAKIGAWWSAQAKKSKREGSPRLDWLCSPVIEKITHQRISKEEETNWIGFVKKTLIDEPLELGLSIGCGTGELERDAVTHKICQKMVAIDIAEGALEIARREAGDLPIKYIQGDLETMSLPPNRYDIAFCSATLHHINRLDHCLSQIHSSLKEGGLFAFFEYVGPSRFQWEPHQLRLVNDVYALLPKEYHFNHDSGTMVASVTRPSVSFMIKNDPSEAVRSHDLLEVTDRYFETLYRIELGGSLMNPLLAGICENFKDNDEVDCSFLQLAALLEESLIEEELLSSNFVVMVCRKREKPLVGAEVQRAEYARSETISRQELEITNLCQRLFEAKTEVEKLLERINEEKARLEAAQRVLEEQERFKRSEANKGFLFRALKATKRILKLVSRLKEIRENGQAPPNANKTHLEISESYISPEARAIKRCFARTKPQSEYLWLYWVHELIGTSSGKALLITSNSTLAQAVVSTGICSSASSSLSPNESFSVAFLDISSGIDDDHLSSILKESNTMVAFSHEESKPKINREFLEKLAGCLPEEWLIATKKSATLVEGKLDTRKNKFAELSGVLPEDFNLVGLRSFGNLFNPLLEKLCLEKGMKNSVAGLLKYIELFAVEAGLASPSVTVGVFKKGLHREEEHEFGTDIVEMQQQEIEGLEVLLRNGIAYKEKLESELEKLVEAVKRTATVLEHPLH